jgi:single-strand DNA-binding protein
MQSIPITVIGNLVRDPEVKGHSGSIVKIRIASTERVNENNEWRDGDTAYFDIACFKTLGENVMSSLKKGDKVVVHGKLKYREFERKTGEKGHDYEILANEVGPALSKKARTNVVIPNKESVWAE